MGYVDRTQKSKKLFERARRVLPGGVTYSLRAVMPHPFYVKHAEGVKLIDVEGNVYTDYWVGHGALLLGHSPRPIIEAVAKQLHEGTHFGFCHELEVELAERIVDMVPSAEMVRYTSSGTEGNLYATRLARSYTKRQKMVKIEGGWHGGYDPLHKAVHAPFNTPESAGLNPKHLEDTIAIPYNDLEAAENALKGENAACLLVEPVLGAGGFIVPESGYLEGLRELCDQTGTLLIFDEVITGFRLAAGCAQEKFGVAPDLTIMGKILGGGFPIGAFTGSAEVFDLIDHIKYPKMEERSAHGGTFTGNPISMTAGIVSLDILKKGAVYKHIDRLGDRMRSGLDELANRYGIKASTAGIGSCFALHFMEKPPRNARDVTKGDLELSTAYFSHMLENNIAYMSPAVCHAFMCEPHTDKDLEEFLRASEEFFKANG